MKMDALNFLKKNDKKKRQKKNTQKKLKNILDPSSLQRLSIDLTNPWTIFTVVDKNVFTQVIDDFVKKAKWRRQKVRRLNDRPTKSDIEFNIDLDSINFENLDTVLKDILWSSTKRDEKEEDIQINEMLAQEDVENIRMFYSLRMFVPWYTAVHFLKEYADDDRGLLAPELYKFYLATPDMRKLTNETVQYLKGRVAKPVGITNKELQDPLFEQIFTDFYNKKNNIEYSKYTYPPPRVTTEYVRLNNKYTVVGGDNDEIVPRRAQDTYGDANAIDTTWLHEYGIKGFVVSDKYDSLATVIEVKYNNQTWYKVNKLFYKQLYADKRTFFPGLIGYVMKDSSIVTETKTMFDRLQRSFEIKETKSQIKTGYEVAIQMINDDILLNTIYNVKDLNVFANKIVDSFKPCESTKEIAKKLSFILVYYRKLVTGTQSYIENTRKKLYAPENLLNLQKDVLLPELYHDPYNKDDVAKNVGTLITQIRREIETEFYIQSKSKVIPEEGRTKVRATKAVSQGEHIKKQLLAGEKFAPGLIQKLKTLINFVELPQCALCNKNVYNFSYKSIYSGEVHEFCNQECFEKFEFKTVKKTRTVCKNGTCRKS